VRLDRIPTALSSAELRALRRFADGRLVIEAGALLGRSTLEMATTAAKIISIDRHKGYGPSTLRPFLSNIEDYRHKVLPIVGDARLVIRNLGELSTRYFIDLDGTYETTLAILGSIPGDCQVAVHDFERSNCRGVRVAIADGGWKVFNRVDTLAFVVR